MLQMKNPMLQTQMKANVAKAGKTEITGLLFTTDGQTSSRNVICNPAVRKGFLAHGDNSSYPTSSNLEQTGRIVAPMVNKAEDHSYKLYGGMNAGCDEVQI
jgi:hypothetical protein